MFPIIGLRIITELSSTEDLPRLQGEELFTKMQGSALAPGLASPIIYYRALAAIKLFRGAKRCQSWGSRNAEDFEDEVLARLVSPLED